MLRLTENAFRKTKHWMMPSIVSPVKQKVPVRCLPRRPTVAVVAKLAWTKALRGREDVLAEVATGFAVLIRRSKESISSLMKKLLRKISFGHFGYAHTQYLLFFFIENIFVDKRVVC